jgi:hypothetical protein
VFAPRQEYWTGIGPPAANAVLVTVMVTGAVRAGSAGSRCPQPEANTAATATTAARPGARSTRKSVPQIGPRPGTAGPIRLNRLNR